MTTVVAMEVAQGLLNTWQLGDQLKAQKAAPMLSVLLHNGLLDVALGLGVIGAAHLRCLIDLLHLVSVCRCCAAKAVCQIRQ